MRHYSRTEWDRVFDSVLGERLGPSVGQEYDEVSAVQLYTLGARKQVDDRVYHYARAGAALVAPCTYRLAVNADLQSATTWGMALAAPGIAVGDRICNVTHANYGLPVATSVALNELVGGWIEIWGAANAFAWRRIVANSASVLGVPATITITVDRPFNFLVAAGAGVVALHRNIYYNVQQMGALPTYQSANGVPPVPVANGSFFWLQTWGPCYIASQLGNPGAVADFRDVYAGAGGALLSLTDAYAAAAHVSPQRVGYIMGMSTNGDGNNDVMLQLAP